MAVVVNEQFASKALRIDDKTARAIWSESDNFTNDPISRDFDRREMALRVECETRTPCD